jgi:flavin-dependent dehydrogenase
MAWSGEHEVCVFGAGPAGLAVAARLLDKGRDVVVVDRRLRARPWGGESFSGSIRGPLRALGFWGRFERAGHVQGYERQAAWGGEPWAESSMLQPSGAQWHVDRERFDDDLRAAMRERAGVLMSYRNLDGVRREAGKWRVSLDGTTEVVARYLVDATGRLRALGHRLGGRIEVHDRLLGLTAKVCRDDTAAEIRSMLIEATPFGWWYAAPTPSGHVFALFTDADLAPPDVRRRLRPVAANSTFMHVEADQGWLAVGDACASHDPLCGWGVHRALTNGLRAADAIEAVVVRGDSSQVEDYRHLCHQQYQGYLEGLARRYSLERRWPGSPFWQRRHHIAAA